MRLLVRCAVRTSLVVFLFTAAATAATIKPDGRAVPREVLVKLSSGVSGNDTAALWRAADADEVQRVAAVRSGAIWRVRSRSKNIEALTAALEKNPHIEYVEPNFLLQLAATPNDPIFPQLWGLKNTGQSISGTTGLQGSDIGAEHAWNVTTGSSSIVVGVVDTGVDYSHPDLAANMWSNPGGKGNPDCAAGTHGFNAINRTCDPDDDHYHGTHVAGTIGAAGNNGLGVTGVNWTTSIMALKFLNANGSGTTADAVAAIQFAVQAKIDGVNVRVLSNSWGGGAFSKALLDVINLAGEHDILFVASAGNDADDNDVITRYPTGYGTPNLISVAAIDNRDLLAYFSNYGATTVHLGAPGVSVRSTFPNNGYGSLSGTSMAAPHVSGVAALLLAKTPSLSTADVKAAILQSTVPIASLAGRTVTGGRLNAARAVGATLPPDYRLSVTPATRTVARGASTTYVVTLQPSGGFSGPVHLTVSGLPPGATAAFSPDTLHTTVTLSVATSDSTPLLTNFLTITGTSGGVTPGIVRSAFATLTVSSTPVSSACPTFALPNHYTLSSPVAVAVSDFNRDGKADVAAASVQNNTITLFTGNAEGNLLPKHVVPVGRMPVAIAAADFDHDGNPDLAVANAGSHNVSILLGNGSGNVTSVVPYAVGTSPFAVATGDFNRDGNVDLAVANNGSSNVSILLGNGNGTFLPAVQYGAGSGPFGLAAADFNGDGRTDLAVAAFNANAVSILSGAGDGTFGAATAYATGQQPSSVAAADFDRDGRLDLAVANHQSDNVSILGGNGDGTFDAPVNYAVDDAPYSIVAADFSGDGIADLATASSGTSAVSLLSGTGSGTFLPKATFGTGSNPQQIAAGDLNGDGKPDLVAAVLDHHVVAVLLNIGVCTRNCGSLASAAHYPSGTLADAITGGDFNRDGAIDLAIANSGANEVAILLGAGNGTFTAGVKLAAGTAPESIAAGDFNGDGRIDLAAANNGSHNVSIFLGAGDGTFLTAANYAAGTNPREVAAGDLDGDGVLDLAVAGGTNSVSILRGNADGTFQAPVALTAGTNPAAVAIADLDRDGNLDLVVANSGSGNLSILRGNGDGTFQAAVNVAAGLNPVSIAIADFDGNAIPDLTVANNTSNNISVLLGNGDGTFAGAVHYGIYGYGVAPTGVTAIDLNDDGRLDIVASARDSNSIAVLWNYGGTFIEQGDRNAGTAPSAIYAADFNRDGKTDLANANRTAGTVSIHLNTCPLPDLTVTKTHTGTFTQGATGRTFTITVTNSGLTSTNATIRVVDTMPAGLVATAMAGPGWSCSAATVTCTRNDALPAGISHPPITLTVNVAGSAPASVTNSVTVSGGGELNRINSTASDTVAVTPLPDLTITATHAGSFTQGDTGRAYRITVRNAGGAASSGMVTAAVTLPSGLTATSLEGIGWSCSTGALTCSRSNALPGNAAFPPIHLTVNVAADAPHQLLTTATVSSSSDDNTANNTASDPTIVWRRQSACATFGGPVMYDAGSVPIAVAIANFNGDAWPDVVAANFYSDNISVLLGTGGGAFANAVNYPAGDAPFAIAVADFNGDAHPDVLVSHALEFSVNKLAILLNNGNGTFAAPIDAAITGIRYPRSVATGDFNSDGRVDVAATMGDEGLAVLLGNGAGGLHQAVLHEPPNYAVAVDVADVNGDGRSDLIVGSNVGLYTMLGNGDGSFAAAVLHNLNRPHSAVATGDFDRDGRIDVVAASDYYGDLTVFRGIGDGTFATPVRYYVPYSSDAVVVADVNGDGYSDLIAATSYYGAVTLLGKADGTFHDYTTNGNRDVDRLAVGDLNGDGRPDLAMTNEWENELAVVFSACTDLSITKTHSGNFHGGQTNAAYTITVTNSGGASSGVITVADHLPAGLTAVSMSGPGWNCSLATLTCTISWVLEGGDRLPQINLIVRVGVNAPASVTNTATVSGGGDTNGANNTASDPTTIEHFPDLAITMTHDGNFAQGQTGRIYTITVRNAGGRATSGTVTVTDTLPFGLVATGMAGTGWNCIVASRTCTRTDALAPGAAYPPILLTVNVNSDAPSSLTNSASVHVSGDSVSGNNNAFDFTAVLIAPLNFQAKTLTLASVNLTWSSVAAATGYHVLRSVDGGPFVVIATPAFNNYLDGSMTANKTYLYRIRATDGTTTGPFSAVEQATIVVFTDDPLVPGVTRAKPMHIEELRAAVNVMRAAAGLAPAVFTDAPVTSRLRVKAVHVDQLRTALNQARTALGLTALTFTDPSLAGKRLRALHLTELREAIK